MSCVSDGVRRDPGDVRVSESGWALGVLAEFVIFAPMRSATAQDLPRRAALGHAYSLQRWRATQRGWPGVRI